MTALDRRIAEMACYFGELPLSIDDSIRIIEAFQMLRIRENPS